MTTSGRWASRPTAGRRSATSASSSSCRWAGWWKWTRTPARSACWNRLFPRPRRTDLHVGAGVLDEAEVVAQVLRAVVGVLVPALQHAGVDRLRGVDLRGVLVR